MIFDPSLVTLSGECDKIGVSYRCNRLHAGQGDGAAITGAAAAPATMTAASTSH